MPDLESMAIYQKFATGTCRMAPPVKKATPNPQPPPFGALATSRPDEWRA
jgi:hypothetical protein